MILAGGGSFYSLAVDYYSLVNNCFYCDFHPLLVLSESLPITPPNKKTGMRLASYRRFFPVRKRKVFSILV
jgi:hypothetical protein